MKKIISLILSLILIINILPLNMIYAQNRLELVEKETNDYILIDVEDSNTEQSSVTTSKTFIDTGEKPELPEVFIMASQYRFFSELDKYQQEEFQNYFKTGKNDFKQLEKEGYTLIDSINIITLSNDYDIFTIDEISKLYSQNSDLIEIEKIISTFGKHTKLFNYPSKDLKELKQYLLEGYEVKSIFDSYILSKSLGIKTKNLLRKKGVSNKKAEKNELKLNKKEEAQLDKVFEQFDVNEEPIAEYLQSKSIAPSQIEQEVSTYMMSTMSTDEQIPLITYDKYVQAPFAFDNNSNEQISLSTGSLIYQKNILQLEGINGLDLSIGIRYDSGKSNLKEETYSYSINSYETKYLVNRLGTAFYIPGQYNLVANNQLNLDYAIRAAAMYDDDYGYTGYLDTFSLAQTEAKNWVQTKAANSRWNHVDPFNEETVSATEYNSQQFCGDLNYFGDNPPSHLVMKYNANATDFQVPVGTYINDVAETTYLEEVSPIGSGWTFNFASLEFTSIVDGYNHGYLHTEDGNQYSIKVSTDGISNPEFKDYSLKDMTLELDNTLTVNSVQSKYALVYKNGSKIYFDQNGRYIAKKDRFSNTITVEYTGANKYPSKIVDTVGREVIFTYTDIAGGKEVTITLPDNNTIVLGLEEITGQSGNYTLKSITDQKNNQTSFEYNISDAKFDFWKKDLTDPASYTTNQYAVMSKITYPTSAETQYSYEIANGNLGNEGLKEYYRISQRKEVENSIQYNVDNYSYTGHFTGYPTYSDPSNIYHTYEYSVSINDSNNLKKVFTMNGDHLLSYTQVLENGTTLKSKSINIYNYNKQTIRKINETYESGLTMSAIENYEYDDGNYGDLTGYWNTQANRDINKIPTDNEHKVTFAYDNNYHITTSKVYKQDSDTTITEEYILDPTGKTIVTSQIKQQDGALPEEIKQKTEYVYDGFGNVIEEKYYTPDLLSYSSIHYSYDDNDVSRNGQLDGAYLTKRWIENIKDADDNLIQSRTGVTAGAIDWTYKYDIMGNLKEETDGEGNSSSYQYDDIGRITLLTNPDNTTVQYSYDDTNNTLTYTDQAGNQFRKEYDGFGNLKYEKSLLPDQTLKTYEYDCKFRLLKEKNADNKQTIEYVYDDFDRVLEKKILDSNSIEQYKETYVYEDVTTSGESKVTKTIVGEVDAPSIVTVTYIDKHGNTTKDGYIKNSQEKLNEYTYNYLGQPIETKTAKHIEENWTESYTQKNEYDYAGRITKQYDINEDYITTEYDQYGNTIKLTDKQANTLATPYSIIYTYDTAGRLIKQETPFEDISGTIYNTISKTYYDRNNNTTKTTITNNKPGESETTKKTEYQYDVMNRLEKITAYDNDTPENNTQYYYDSRGNKVRMYTGLSSPLTITGLDTVSGTDTEYSVTKYEYDKFNNLTKLTDALGQEQTYVYDDNNNLTQKTDRNGNTIHYDNDDLNRLTLQYVEYADNTTGEAVSFIYTKTSQTKTETNDTITKTYTYDEIGKLVTETNTDGSEKTYTYDTSGNRKSFVLKVDSITKENTSYEYDKQERLDTVKENGSTIAAYTYDTNGNRQSLSYTNGNNTDYTYNLANKIKTLTNKQGSTILEQYIYEYSLDGNQTKETESVSNKTTDYVYDDLGRLENETNKTSGATTASLTYTFDDYNNRATLATLNDTTSYTYDKNNRLLTEEKVTGSITKTTRYTYDYNGNQLLTVSETIEPSTAQPEEYHIMLLGVDQQTDVTYNEYDSYNRLTKAIVSDTVAEYEYAPNGLRLNKKINGNTTSYVWDGTNIVFEKESTNEVKYIRGINLISRQTVAQEQYYLFNAHGDVTALTSNTGQVEKSYEYDAYGNEVNPDINDANPFRYSGEFYDKETGTYYLRARYYDPSIGRFITEDMHWNINNMIYGDYPIGIKMNDKLGLNVYSYIPSIHAIRQSSNKYGYCMNNPIMYVDENGEWVTIAIGAVAGAIIGGGIDAISQLASGTKVGDLDWKSIAISSGSGAISGALAGSGAGLGLSIAANATLSGATTIVRQTMYGEDINWQEVTIDTGIGALAGYFGGAGAQNGVNRVSYEIKNIFTSFQSVVKVTYKNPTAALAVKKEMVKALVKMGISNIVIEVKDNIIVITNEVQK